MMDQEVEIRALFKEGDKAAIREKILRLGVISKGLSSIHDVYYCDKSCQKVEDAEMNQVGSYSVRIRKELKDGDTAISYNKKTITTEGDHNSWKEKEEPRGDFEEANQEMIAGGYKFFFELNKEREICVELYGDLLIRY
jgi:hypothetical protein